jgi:tetratricopeptide (TPR) repeat protein
MKKSKEKTAKFPNISRIITETKGKLSWDEKKHFIYLLIVVFFLLIAFMVIDLKQKIVMAKALSLEKIQVTEEIKNWEKVVDKYKDYKDGYLELAILQYRMGNKTKAKENLEKVFKIDPNSKEGRELEKFLNNN